MNNIDKDSEKVTFEISEVVVINKGTKEILDRKSSNICINKITNQDKSVDYFGDSIGVYNGKIPVDAIESIVKGAKKKEQITINHDDKITIINF